MTAPATSGVRFPPPLLFLLPLALGLVLTLWVFPTPLIAVTFAWALACLPLLFWLGLAASSLLAFRRARTSINPTVPTAALVMHGPYRISRNPMYLSFVLLYLGLAIGFQSFWALLLLPLAFWAVEFRVIRLEERYLEQKFGSEYVRYREQVRRWL
jgi:protein-S-isoprenylcysteine O-methyltransferase Ste14